VTWTLAHAMWMLALAAVSLLLHSPLVAAVGGAASLGFFVLGNRGRFTAQGPFGAANAVTSLRLALVVAIAASTRAGPALAIALVLFLALDGVDGYLARVTRAGSRFGARYDMETDALLVLVAGLKLFAAGRLGAFVVIPGLLRYTYAAAVVLLPEGRGEAPRSLLGRSVFAVVVLAFSVSAWPLLERHGAVTATATALIVLSFARGVLYTWGPQNLGAGLAEPPDGEPRGRPG